MTDRDRIDRNAAWTRVRALFEQCVELPRAQRVALLLGADPEVRAEAEALLREVDTNPGRLDPELGHQALVDSAERLLADGHTIDGYTILEVLGHGGMSTVYLAQQQQPRRRVALKLLTSVLSSPDSRQRFQNEGELLARLHHPGIAQIHHAGLHQEDTAIGQVSWPYIVMEYVEGARTLAEFVAATKPDDHKVLELFLQIAAAVQHAHERGVVHRDLKPQNILVDSQGRAKVIDFGIARRIADSRIAEHLTRPGDLIGTLHYMSPEQVRGDRVIDTRSDVHALGAVLFQLLTGRLPFELDGKSLPEVGRILTETEATPLRHLRPDVDADLELILGKALAKAADHRYSTAGALAEDVQRYLDRQPINARHPSLRYQLQMFARRRRGLVLGTLAVILVSTVGGVSSVVYAIRAHSAEALAVKESELKDDALRRTFDMAVSTVIDLPRRLEGVPRATDVRRALVREAARQLEFVEANLPIVGGMRESLARAHYELGLAQSADAADQEAIELADSSFDRTESYLEAILQESPEDRAALHLRLDLALHRGMAAFNRRRDTATAKAQWSVLAATIDKLANLPPSPDRDLRRDRANHEGCLALIAMMDGDVEVELRHLERSRELTLARDRDSENDIDIALALGNVCLNIGLAQDRARDPARALDAYAEGVEHLELAHEHPDDVAFRLLRARIRSRYGYALAVDGRPTKGEPHLWWSWKELGWLHERDPNDAAVASAFALASSLLAEFLVVEARHDPDPERAREAFIEGRKVARAGLEVTEHLLERSRDMQEMFVAGVCRSLIEACDEALK